MRRMLLIAGVLAVATTLAMAAWSTTLTETRLAAFDGERSDWWTAHAEPDSADNSGNPVLTLAQAESGGNARALELPRDARYLAVRLRYDDGCTPNADPVVEVLAFDGTGAIGKLRNLNGAVAATLTTATTTDPQDGTYAYTVPDDAAVFDVLGARRVVVAVKTVFTVSAGDATNAALEAKALR